MWLLSARVRLYQISLPCIRRSLMSTAQVLLLERMLQWVITCIKKEERRLGQGTALLSYVGTFNERGDNSFTHNRGLTSVTLFLKSIYHRYCDIYIFPTKPVCNLISLQLHSFCWKCYVTEVRPLFLLWHRDLITDCVQC